MGENSKIEWCDHTFNPWSGCQKVSPGCPHCYAETMAKRNPKTLGTWGPQGTRVRMSAVYWRQPYKWNDAAQAAGTQARVFCASLADVFEDRPELVDWRIDLFKLIEQTHGLNWLLLSKRPENVVRMIEDAQETVGAIAHGRWWLARNSHVWVGATSENQGAAEERIPHLLKIPATVRFLSMEPLLGPVDLSIYPGGVDWVIVGGESGAHARPMHPDWVRSLRDQCQDVGVPFFFKQWGEWIPQSQMTDEQYGLVAELDPDSAGGVGRFKRDNRRSGGELFWHVGKKAAGRMLDGQQWDMFPVAP